MLLVNIYKGKNDVHAADRRIQNDAGKTPLFVPQHELDVLLGEGVVRKVFVGLAHIPALVLRRPPAANLDGDGADEGQRTSLLVRLRIEHRLQHLTLQKSLEFLEGAFQLDASGHHRIGHRACHRPWVDRRRRRGVLLLQVVRNVLLLLLLVLVLVLVLVLLLVVRVVGSRKKRQSRRSRWGVGWLHPLQNGVLLLQRDRSRW